METMTFGQLAGVALIILAGLAGLSLLYNGWPNIKIIKKDQKK